MRFSRGAKLLAYGPWLMRRERILSPQVTLHTYGSIRPFWRRPAGRSPKSNRSERAPLSRNEELNRASSGFPEKHKAYPVHTYGPRLLLYIVFLPTFPPQLFLVCASSNYMVLVGAGQPWQL